MFPFIKPRDQLNWFIFDVIVTIIVYRVMVERSRKHFVDQFWLNALFLGMQFFFFLATLDPIIFLFCTWTFLTAMWTSTSAIDKIDYEIRDKMKRDEEIYYHNKAKEENAKAKELINK
jgi:hypothetical protein